MIDVARTRHHPALIALHWIVALAVLVQVALISWAGSLPEGAPNRGMLVNGHKSLGLVILVLVVVRLGARLRFGTPRPAERRPAWQQGLATATHVSLYALLLAMPVTGLLFNARPLPFFGVIALPPLAASQAVRDAAHAAHVTAPWLLYALVLVHASAALAHHYLWKDDTLLRMLPGHPSRPSAAVSGAVLGREG